MADTLTFERIFLKNKNKNIIHNKINYKFKM